MFVSIFFSNSFLFFALIALSFWVISDAFEDTKIKIKIVYNVSFEKLEGSWSTVLQVLGQLEDQN